MKDKEKQKLTFEQECSLIANGEDLPQEKQIESKVLSLGNELYCKQDEFDMSNPYEVAEAVISLGYRKIDKDKEVVLSKEEFKRLLDNNIRVDMEYLEQEKAKASNETAEKILREFEYCNDTTFYAKWLDLCKQYSVEVEK